MKFLLNTTTLCTLILAACLFPQSWAQAQGEAGIALGVNAPIVSVHDLDGKPVDLGIWIGKQPVFLEFWATWCEQCEALLPRVQAAEATYGTKVAFLGVNVVVNQTPERVRRYASNTDVPFQILYDDQGASIRAYQVPTTSFVVIVDRSGKVAYTGVGGDQPFEAALEAVAKD